MAFSIVHLVHKIKATLTQRPGIGLLASGQHNLIIRAPKHLPIPLLGRVRHEQVARRVRRHAVPRRIEHERRVRLAFLTSTKSAHQHLSTARDVLTIVTSS